MFQGLSTITTSIDMLNSPRPVLPKHRLVLAVQRHAATMNRLTQRLGTMHQIANDFSDLRHLKAVISVEGIGRSMMMFVNPGNNVISQNIPALPSNESLDSVSLSSTDRRTVAAIEGISETLDAENQLIASWISVSAEDLPSLLSDIEAQFSDYDQSIDNFLNIFENGNITDADLSTDNITVVPYDAALTRIDALINILPDMDIVVSDSTDGDAMADYKEKLNTLVDAVGEICGLTLEENSPYLILADDVSDEFSPKSGTLIELGYTADNIVEMLHRADTLIDELAGLVSRKEAMLDNLASAATSVIEVDNDVPPAVDGAIVGGNPDEDSISNGTGITQVDMYHYQISSGIYALAVVTAISLNAISEILTIADSTAQ